MYGKILVLLFGTVFVNVAQGGEAGAVENPNAWLRTDVMQAAYEIAMTDAQRAQFAGELRRFVENYQQSVDRILKRGDVSDPAGLIKRRRNSLAKKMDQAMADVLQDTQVPAYERYRDLLLAEMGNDVDDYFRAPNEADIRVGNPGAH